MPPSLGRMVHLQYTHSTKPAHPRFTCELLMNLVSINCGAGKATMSSIRTHFCSKGKYQKFFKFVMSTWLLLPLLLIILGLWLLRQGRRSYQASGLPTGDVIYSDTGAWQQVEKALVNRQHGLVGKPDYLVRVTEKGRIFTVPVEVKSAKRPTTPHPGHLLQLGAYCLLVEAAYQQTPPYGLLHYADATLRIPFTDELRREVLAVAEALRRDQQATDVKRSHDERQRCRACGYQHRCGEQKLK